MNNVAGLTEIGLDVFSGNNLDMQPTDLPQGLSPDCSDVAFLPGSVFTRPSLRRLITAGFNSQCVYAKTFLKPDGTVSQLMFMADGRMYQDGVQFGMTQPGNRFQACNAFNKMYIAISDGLHGADVPLQLTPEGWLDRVSQDGPGAPPTISNYALPTVNLVAGSSGPSITISTATPINPEQVQTGGGYDDGSGYIPPTYETFYTSLQFTTATPHGLVAGQTVTITGNSLYSLGTASVSQIDSATVFEVLYNTQSSSIGTGGTAVGQAPLLSRTSNVVTATTASPHNLRIGYRATIAGVPDATQTLTNIVVDNETLNGIATVTTPSPHGFVPGNQVSITGVNPAVVGGSITSWQILNGTLTMTTASPHLLQPGDAVIQSTGTGYLVACNVDTVVSPTVITISVPGATNASGTTNATLTTPFPLPSGTIVTISAVPNPTTFQFAMTGADATFTTGSISFPWNGTFYVTSVLSSTSFTYSQTGPNASIQTGSGTVTPGGQISPGKHACVLIFRTRTGYLTIPSPPVTIPASGGQYLFVSNIPIGPSNVTERWMAFTGANGGRYFILPIPPRDPSGQFAIGTATVVPDNTTTSAIFDFTDESLFAGIAIDIPGNNLFRQQVLGPCLGFFSYGSRIFSWGERNKVQLFRNMGFEGGTLSGASNGPLGWNITGSDGILTAGDYGSAWQATTATISQTAYQNQNGTAIIQPNTQYTYRAWVNGTSIATLSSVSTGFTAVAQISGSSVFSQVEFSSVTPIVIPSDLTLTISQTGTTTHDELEIIYTHAPYILTAKVSYVNNPEAFDGVTGILGPVGDPHPIMGMEERKDVLCLLTAGPEGSLYETQQTTSGEPSTWDIDHKASKCGLISVWGTAKFEDWFCWTSDTGLRIFDGSNVDKMSQEIQPWWNSLNPSAKQFTTLANDPYTRRCYISAPRNTSMVADSLYVLDYRDLNTAGMLANSGTLRVGYTGKVVTTDLTRKWSPWSMTMNYIGLLTLSSGEAVMAFSGGTGVSLSDAANGAVYELEEGTISGIDQDYGPFWQNSRYPTYFFVGVEEAAQMQLGKHRLLHAFMTMNVTGVGRVYLTPNLDRMGNTGNPTRTLLVDEDLDRDLEFALNNAAERISYTIQCVPDGVLPAPPTAPAGFRVSSLVLGVKTHPFSPIRGKNS